MFSSLKYSTLRLIQFTNLVFGIAAMYVVLTYVGGLYGRDEPVILITEKPSLPQPDWGNQRMAATKENRISMHPVMMLSAPID